MVFCLRKRNTICFKICLNKTDKGNKKKRWKLDRRVTLIPVFVLAKWFMFTRPEEILCINGCKGKHGKDLWDKSPQGSYRKYWCPSPVPTFIVSQYVQPTICNKQNSNTLIKNQKLTMQNSQFHFIHLELSMLVIIRSILIIASTEEWANSTFVL